MWLDIYLVLQSAQYIINTAPYTFCVISFEVFYLEEATPVPISSEEAVQVMVEKKYSIINAQSEKIQKQDFFKEEQYEK